MPPVKQAGSRTKSYTCEECGQVLSRQDHLDRHQATAHADRGTLHACTECGRKFSRSDVLLRHYRALHGIHCEPRPKGRPKKAVTQLANKSSSSSVSARRSSNAVADGPSEGESVDRSGRNSGKTQSTTFDGQNGVDNPRAIPSSANTDSQWEMLLTATASEQRNGSLMLQPDIPSTRHAFAEDTLFNQDFLTDFPKTPAIDGLGAPSFDDFDSTISLLGWMNGEDQSSSFTYTGLPDLTMPDVQMTGFEGALRTPSMPQPDFSRDSGAKTVNNPPPPMGSLSTNATALPSPSASEDVTPGSPLGEVPDPVPVDRESRTWPFEYDTSVDEPKIDIPVLSPEDLDRVRSTQSDAGVSSPEKSFRSLGSFAKVDHEQRSRVIHLLSLPLARVPWQEDVALLRSLPSPEILHHFTDLYFLHFHQLWPIIHQPTFKVAEAPTILILSMACIGACYSGLGQSLEFADALAELCRRTATWMGEHDPRFLRSPSYGIALLLQHVYAMGSGSRRLFEMTDSLRSRLVSIGRQMNLVSQYASSQAKPSSSQNRDVFERWLEWVKQEQLKRFIWFTFEFDCLYTAFSTQPPCIKIDELPPEFPCEELHWNAPTAFAWAACPYEVPPRGLPTKQTIQGLLTRDGKSIAASSKLDHHGKRLLLRCIGRNLEACHEQMDSSVYGILWKHNDGREVALNVRSQLSKAIMSIYESSWADHPRRFTLHQAWRIGVACHYSHIFAAGRLVDIVTRLARKWAAPVGMTKDTSTCSIDEAAIKAALNEDPERVREMAWHASQVFYVQRRHPFNSPHEPLSVFLAGISLWAFTKYFFPGQEENLNNTKCGSGLSIQLDEPSFCGSPEADRAVEQWIKMGGKTFLEGVGDVSSPEAPRRILHLCVDMTRRLKVWKMASRVSDIFARLLHREDQESNCDSVGPR